MTDFGPTARVFDVSFRDWGADGKSKQEGIVNVTVRVAHARTPGEAQASALLLVEEIGDFNDFTPEGPGVVRQLGPDGTVAGFGGSSDSMGDAENC